jgi:uncharacterized membrane protein YfcA
MLAGGAIGGCIFNIAFKKRRMDLDEMFFGILIGSFCGAFFGLLFNHMIIQLLFPSVFTMGMLELVQKGGKKNRIPSKKEDDLKLKLDILGLAPLFIAVIVGFFVLIRLIISKI